MKGRHHKPVKNELATWLGEHLEQWRPYFPHIGIVAAILVVGSIVYIVFSGEDTSSASAWQAYFAAYGEPKVEDALKRVAEKQKDTLPGRWARLAYADQQLRQATMQLGQNPQEAKTKLASIEKTLKEAETGATEPALLTRVRLSLAKVYESQNKMKEASEYYTKVADPKNNEETFAKAAAKSLKRLEQGSDVPELLAWLDKQEPDQRPKASGSPFDFGPPEALPERPDLSIPGEMKFGEQPPLGLGPLKGPTIPRSDIPGEPKSETPSSPKGETPQPADTKTPPAVPKPVKPAIPMPVKPVEKSAEPKAKSDAEEKPADK